MDNPSAQKMLRRLGDNYILTKDPWFKQASGIRHRAKRDGIPFGFATPQELAVYLRSIIPPRCPVFNTEWVRGKGAFHPEAPSVDRIVGEAGYVRGNLQVISFQANRMKNAVHPSLLRAFAEWALR